MTNKENVMNYFSLSSFNRLWVVMDCLPAEEFQATVSRPGQITSVDNFGETRPHGRLAHVARRDTNGQIAVTPQLV